MPRNPRSVWPGVAHHITQRGVDRQDVFFSHQDREVYLDLVQQNLADARIRVLAYCLMTNHVHWLMIPDEADSLARLFWRVHGRYAQYVNARRGRVGHLWQNRYFSCAVAADRQATVLRYVEGNPVRAGLVSTPEEYAWSRRPRPSGRFWERGNPASGLGLLGEMRRRGLVGGVDLRRRGGKGTA